MPYGPKIAEYRRRLALESGGIGLSMSQLSTTIQNKTKLVAWLVSNCNSKSGRDRYVEELKKHVSVDVYGNCGQLKCNNENEPYACCKLIPGLSVWPVASQLC